MIKTFIAAYASLLVLLPAGVQADPIRYDLTFTGAADPGIYDHSAITKNQVPALIGDGNNSTDDPPCVVCHFNNSVRVISPNASGAITLGSRRSDFFAVPLTIHFYGDTAKVDRFPDQASSVGAVTPGEAGSAAGWYLAEGRATLSGIRAAAPLSDIRLVAIGGYHSCALAKGGQVLCWGENYNGQIGGTGPESAVPTPVPGLATGARGVGAGISHSCAVTATGGVKCWGYNGDGELGNGALIDSPVPVDVAGLSGVRALVSGSSHNCALKSDGSVWCWGANYNGEVGNPGAGTVVTTAVQVTGLASGVRALAAGSSFTCALQADGSVACWGYGYDGETGNPLFANSPTPNLVSGLGAGVVAITAGQSTGCALKSDGTVWCWGYNNEGELGNASLLSSATPVLISGVSGVVGIAASGDYYSLGSSICALKADGSVSCWGTNSVGELGNGSYTDSVAPVAVQGLPAGVVSLASGVYNGTNCAITRGGKVSCWGYNRHGQLARGGDQSTAAPALSYATPARALSASFDAKAGLFVSVDGPHHSIGIGSGWPASVVPTLPGGILGDGATDEWLNTATFAVDSYDLKSAFSMTGFDLINGGFPAGWPVTSAPLPLIGGGQLVLNNVTPKSTAQGSFTATPLLPAKVFLARGHLAKGVLEATGTLTLGAGAKAFDPAADDLVLGFGSYTALLPPGSLHAGSGGALAFTGDVNGTWMDVTLSTRDGSTYGFAIEAQGVPPVASTAPLDVQFYLGDNAAATTLRRD